MILTCWLGVHQWRADHYTQFNAERLRLDLIQRVSCERCGLLRSKSVVPDDGEAS